MRQDLLVSHLLFVERVSFPEKSFFGDVDLHLHFPKNAGQKSTTKIET